MLRFEEELAAAGNRLRRPPDSLHELLSLLDQTEDYLTKVEQSPAKSVKTALSPLMSSLIADELLKHPDNDVKVAVASCINEITRITAPDAPYDDEKMKDIFQLIVSSFEYLYDKSSRSYDKRVMILETVSKVRSCVVMLDLECDQMITEMFQHFLKAIRDYHPKNVFSSMETIMTLILEESEEISSDLLTILLTSVKRNSEEFPPVAMKLGETVFEKCAAKLRPYLTQIVKSLGISVDDYSEVVASVCKETDEPVDHISNSTHGKQAVTERKSTSDSVDEALATQVAEHVDKDIAEETSPEEQNHNVKCSPTVIASNGGGETGDGRTLINKDLKKAEEIDDKITSERDSEDLASQKPVNTESKPQHASQERGSKPNSSNNSIGTSDTVEGEIKMEQVPDDKGSHGSDVNNSPGKEATVNTAESLDEVKETGICLSPSKASERKGVNFGSPSPTGGLLDESRRRKGGSKKRKANMIKEKNVCGVDSAEKASDGASDSEEKKLRHLGKEEPAEISNENQLLGKEDAAKDGGLTSHTEEELPNETEKLVDANDTLNGVDKPTNARNKMKDAVPSKKKDNKNLRRVKAGVKKDILKFSTKDNARHKFASPRSPRKSTKDDGNQEETPKVGSKRKGTPATYKTSEMKKYGLELVGSKVKVWWPEDKTFYEGVVGSFDPVKMKHRILYQDGDEEVLNLEDEKFKIIDSPVLNVGQPVESASTGTRSETKTKKPKTNRDASTNDGKTKISHKSKQKNTATRSGKSKRDAKADSDSDDDTSSSGGNSEDDYPKTSGKSKDADIMKTSHSKQDAKKTPNSKGKTPQISKKPGANAKGKGRSSLSKSKETDQMKDKTTDSGKMSEKKGKLQNTSKQTESETKRGKKRGRGAGT